MLLITYNLLIILVLSKSGINFRHVPQLRIIIISFCCTGTTEKNVPPPQTVLIHRRQYPRLMDLRTPPCSLRASQKIEGGVVGGEGRCWNQSYDI